MIDSPGFDPFEVLGVGPDADAVVVQLAYRARIRAVHPDLAGSAGLEQAKRLNVARDWLLDPDLRARLRPSTPGWPPGDGGAWGARPRTWRPRTGPRRAAESADPAHLDPLAADLGPHADELRAFIRAIGTLTSDERARVNHGLGDVEAGPVRGLPGVPRAAALGAVAGPPAGRRPGVGAWRWTSPPRTSSRSAASSPAGSSWPTPTPSGSCWPTSSATSSVMPRSGASTSSTRSRLAAVGPGRGPWASRATAPTVLGWRRSSGRRRRCRWKPRNASRSRGSGTSVAMGCGRRSHGVGPGVWLPAPPNVPEVLRVSGFLAAVDATRIEPPPGLAPSAPRRLPLRPATDRPRAGARPGRRPRPTSTCDPGERRWGRCAPERVACSRLVDAVPRAAQPAGRPRSRHGRAAALLAIVLALVIDRERQPIERPWPRPPPADAAPAAGDRSPTPWRAASRPSPSWCPTAGSPPAASSGCHPGLVSRTSTPTSRTRRPASPSRGCPIQDFIHFRPPAGLDVPVGGNYQGKAFVPPIRDPERFVRSFWIPSPLGHLAEADAGQPALAAAGGRPVPDGVRRAGGRRRLVAALRV